MTSPPRVIPWVLLLLAMGPAEAWAGLADRIGATFELMAKDFVEAFQPVEGVVVGLEGDRVYVDVGESKGGVAGQELTVFRKGDVFYHPLTGKPLGRYESVLGHAQVRRVLPGFAEARFVPAGDQPPPAPGDGVRITRGRIQLGVTPVLDLTEAKADLRRVPFLIATALERSKRFQAVDLLAVTDAFANGEARVEEVLALPDRARRVSARFDLAGWVVPVLLERRGTLYLDATWISAVTGTALFSRRQPLLPATATEEQRFPWEPAVED